MTLLDVLGTEPEIVQETVEGRFEEDRLRERVKRLSPRERNVLVLRFGLFNSFRKTQREIARMLGISRSYVSRIEKRAIQKLMRELSMDSPSNKYKP
ncbi:MAG: sigma-70 family RNA polymerase sigma factor [Bacillota bacterium]